MIRDDVSQKLNAVAAYDDEGSGLVRVLLKGEAFNYNSIMTLADSDGNRLTDLEFDIIGDSSCGLFQVHVPGGKYGYLGLDGKFAIQPIYDYAQDFSDDVAWVGREGKMYILDRFGNEVLTDPLPNGEYSVVEPFSEGLARVSIMNMGGFWGYMSLAYHHDDSANAGLWGYVDKAGKVVVTPQYIFAEDFCGGLAVVCQGKWTIDKKWDNEYDQGKYWSEEMKWGAINSKGEEAIPCRFDEIKWRPWKPDDGWDMEITKRYLAARDMESRKWGLIDFKGNWVVEPQFPDICYPFETSPNGDMFVFYSRGIWDDSDEPPCGVYSISKRRILIPADEYLDIEFKSDSVVKVADNEWGDNGVEIPIPQ